MPRTRAVLAGGLAVLLLPLAAPVSAATTPAAGSATSSATLVSLAAAGHTLSVGTLEAIAQTVTTGVPKVRFVPVTVDGTETGAVTVDPSSSPKTVGGVDAPAVPGGAIAATSPSATLRASNPASGPTSGVDAGLGSASVLGMPLTLGGGVTVGSVSSPAHAQAGKRIQLSGVALPSLGDLLGALGLDISELPVDTLGALLSELPIPLSDAVVAAAAAADQAIADAETAAGQKQDAYDTAVGALATGNQTEATTEAAFLAALAALPVPLTLEQWNELDPAAQQLTAAWDEYTAWQAAQDALPGLQQAVTDAQTQLNGALAALASAVQALADLVAGVLNDTPLAEVGSADVTVLAYAGAARKADVTGTVSGVKVLGADVLDAILGSSSYDVAKLVGDTATAVNDAIGEVMTTLSSVLSTATGATGLVVPVPQVEVMKVTKAVGTDGAFRTADATVSVLTLSLGSLTIPAALALPDAISLPGVTQQGSTYKTAAVSFGVASVKESARFRPAVTSTTGTPGGGLPATGGSGWVALVALVAAGGALALRRKATA